jgi:hypothetical protein
MGVELGYGTVFCSSVYSRVFTEKEGVQNVLMGNFSQRGTEKLKGRSTSVTYGVQQYGSILNLIDFFLMYNLLMFCIYALRHQRDGGRSTYVNDDDSTPYM